jgi:glycosyltransferase involved in cell wall biosynthesis
MNSNLVSVIIASYNYQNLIEKAIESVLIQTYKNWELIIVEDGSTDNSEEIIQKYLKNPKIKLFKHEDNVNKGLKETLLLGLRNSSGKYIAFLEADDWWEKDCLDKKMKIVNEDENIKFVFSDVYISSEKNDIRWYESYFKNQKDILNKHNMPFAAEKYFKKHNFIPTFSCVLVEKKLLENCDFETPNDPTLDYWLFKQLSTKTDFYYISDKLTNWRLHDDSYINTIFTPKNDFEGFESIPNQNMKNNKKISKHKKIKQNINKHISNLLKIVSKKRYDTLKKKYNILNKKNEEILKDLYDNNQNIHSEEYIKKTDRYFKRKKNDPKLIAFYLPQFHTIPENDEWWGKGFTEWYNVTTGQPQFIGHYQPHLPDELGFYDLSNNETLTKQIELAKKYGIFGFCFHYYWFSGGKRLLEKPIFNYLNEKNLDFPFMLCWANEPWSRRWDGSENDILMNQDFKEEDIKRFIGDIMPFFKDDRYIKINNSPILIVYRPYYISNELIDKAIETWRKSVKKEGFNDLYLMYTKTGDCGKDLSKLGFDARIEFPPNCIKYATQKKLKVINPKYMGKVFNLPKSVIENNKIKNDDNIYKTVFPSWDNTARKKNDAHIFYDSSPEFYKKWLYNSIKETDELHPENKLVFINAWNEWAEGAHLEPDRKYGFAYLEATLDALLEYRLDLPFYDLEKE